MTVQENVANSSWADDVIPILQCPSYTGPQRITGYAGTTDAAITNYKALGATSKLALQSTPEVTSSNGNGGAIHPYGAVRALQATSQTALITETIEENNAAWVDGATASIWGLQEAAANTAGTDPANVVKLNNVDQDGANSDFDTGGTWGTTKWGPSSAHAGLVIHSFGDTGTRAVTNEVEPAAYHALITRKSADNGEIGDFFN